MNVPGMIDGPANGTSVVGNIGSAQFLMVKIQIQDRLVTALIDKESEATIMQDKVFDTLPSKPYVLRETIMHGAGRNMQVTCRITNRTEFGIEDLLFSHQLYVALSDCEMLQGCDFLSRNGIVIYTGNKHITVQGKTINIILGRDRS